MAKPYNRKFAVENEPLNETYLNDTDIGEYQFTNLLPSTQYEMKVFAYSAGGGKGVGSVMTRFTDMVSNYGNRRRLKYVLGTCIIVLIWLVNCIGAGFEHYILY